MPGAYCGETGKEVNGGEGIKIREQRSDAEKETKLSAEYRIGGYPTALAAKKSGWNKTKKLPTYVSPDEFISACKKAGLPVS